MSGPGERLGVFGGTFDPPHVGHLAAAVAVRHELGLDRVLMMVANRPWQKVGAREITPAVHRLAMAERLVAQVDGLEVSALEIERGGDSYTVDTLEQLAGEDPSGERFLVVGADAVAGLDSWHRAADLPGLAVLVVVERPGHAVVRPGPPWRTRPVDIPALDVASADLRTRASVGRPIDGLTLPAVVTYVHEHRLYGGRP